MAKIIRLKQNVLLNDHGIGLALEGVLHTGCECVVRDDEQLQAAPWVEVVGEAPPGDGIKLLPPLLEDAILYLDSMNDTALSGSYITRLMLEELINCKFFYYPVTLKREHLTFSDLPNKRIIDVTKTKPILCDFSSKSSAAPGAGVGIWIESKREEQISDHRIKTIVEKFPQVTIFANRRYVLDYLPDSCYNFTGRAQTYRDLAKMISGLDVALGVPSTFANTAYMMGVKTLFLGHEPNIIGAPYVTADCILNDCRVCNLEKCVKVESFLIEDMMAMLEVI